MPHKRAPWTYVVYAPQTPTEAFGIFAPFVALWRSKFGADEQLPAWRDFELMDFQPWWGKLSLLEIEHDPLSARWRLWGTQMVEWWGVDYTGRKIDEIPEVQAIWVNTEKPYFEHLIQSRGIGFVTGTLAPQNMEYINIHGVDLPLETNGVISHYLSVYQLRDEKDLFFPDAAEDFRI